MTENNSKDMQADLTREVAEAAAWRVRLTEADCDSTEEFEAWLAYSSRHADAWARVSETWGVFAEHAIAPEIMTARSEALDRARKAHANRTRVSMLRSKVNFRRPVGLATAAAAAVIALSVGIWGWSANMPTTYATALGERRVLRLEDGSTVTLDSNSVLTVSLQRDARRLELKRGQARFDVAHDPGRPFSVHVRDQTVVATGTSFDVDYLDKTVFVTLIQGHVSVFDDRRGLLRESAEPVRPVAKLNPGEQLSSVPAVADGGPPSATIARGVSLDQATAWQAGKLIFSDEPLSLVAARVNRYSSRKLAVEGAAGGLKLSGVFDMGDAGTFADAVQRLLPIEASTGPDGVIRLRRAGGGDS
jgi:transmembrane sensor